ncbi:MAG: 16S rRNA (cytidine(1402)-2'-O)-methyltransferase, partial [Ureaplasma sp.]|nr:16S rRNA (cytidine(1402)-2'-O)-methyltransferase [Ureaplasma sp.]
MSNNHKLYIGATPIGNLSDISDHLLIVLENINYIFCEDTRVTQKLLDILNIQNKPKLISFYKFNENEQINKAKEILAQDDVLLVSDAGYPNISDPGYGLVKYCVDNNVEMEVISGPCALIHALVKSGISTNTFMFLGFLNPKRNQQLIYFENLINIKTTFIIYESVHKIINTLKNLSDIFPNNKMCVCKELTKMHETFFYGNANEIINQLNDNNLKGEFVIIIDNNNVIEKENKWLEKAKKLKDMDLSNKTILEILLLDFPNNKNEIYS